MTGTAADVALAVASVFHIRSPGGSSIAVMTLNEGSR